MSSPLAPALGGVSVPLAIITRSGSVGCICCSHGRSPNTFANRRDLPERIPVWENADYCNTAVHQHRLQLNCPNFQNSKFSL